MATSSITRNFIISKKEDIEKFANAVELSANCSEEPLHVSARELQGEELRKFIERTLEVNVRR